MSEHERTQIDESSFFRKSSRRRRVERIAGRRSQHHIRRRKFFCPVFSVGALLQQLGMAMFTAGKTVDRAHQIRERFNVRRAKIMSPAEDCRKTHHFRFERSGAARHIRFETFDHVFKDTAVTVHTRYAHGNQQAGLKQLFLTGAVSFGETFSSDAAHQIPSLWAISMVALSFIMRSLLTMIAAP